MPILNKCFALLLLLSLSLSLAAQTNLNVNLFGQFHRGDDRYSGSWSYVTSDGAEYVLLGTSTGTAAYPIDNAANITEVGFIPGPPSNWREITVLGDYAYVTTEGSAAGVGMQVIDLSYLPDSLSLLTTYDETFTRGHIIQRDIYSEAPYLYINGTTATEGIHILDVSDPSKPLEVGLYQPGYYIHDCHVNDEYLYAAAFFEGKVDVINITDKTQPVLEWSFNDPNGNTHSSWLTEDKTHLFLASEADGLIGQVFNIEEPQNVRRVATYTANDSTLVHNPYIRGDYAFISHNSEGIRVVDIVDPALPVEVGYYDTYAGPSGGSSGLWSACPYFPSGKIIGGNREDGLYVWTFNNTLAARVYGLVTDSITGMILPGAEITIVEKQDTLIADLQAQFKYGNLAGVYTFKVTLDGYVSKEISLNLMQGDQEQLIIELAPEGITATHRPLISSFSVSPNPASYRCLVDLSALPEANLLRLSNMAGKSLLTQAIEKGTSTQDVDLQSLAPGLYYIDLFNAQKQVIGQASIVVSRP